jgi:hypothetical protein
MMDAVASLLGGARRRRTRVRGFAPWRPHDETLRLLELVRAVLVEYAEYLPLTLRQVFYRLLGAHGYAKTEQAYERLGETLNRARRARLISMGDIRDDGGTTIAANMWASAEEFLDTVRDQAGRLMLDRTAGQRKRLVVTCEAAGMVSQLARVANSYGITVMSSGGFESVTDQPTEVLDIGDQDASGAHKYLAYCEDIIAFTRELGGEATFTRLAVTPQQIHDLRLPTAPPKPTDRRAFRGQTCQAEAIAPDVLADILRSAIEARIDHAAYARVLRRERKVRRELIARLDG